MSFPDHLVGLLNGQATATLLAKLGVTVSVAAQPAEASGAKKAPPPNSKTKKRKPNTPAPDAADGSLADQFESVEAKVYSGTTNSKAKVFSAKHNKVLPHNNMDHLNSRELMQSLRGSIKTNHAHACLDRLTAEAEAKKQGASQITKTHDFKVIKAKCYAEAEPDRTRPTKGPNSINSTTIVWQIALHTPEDVFNKIVIVMRMYEEEQCLGQVEAQPEVPQSVTNRETKRKRPAEAKRSVDSAPDVWKGGTTRPHISNPRLRLFYTAGQLDHWRVLEKELDEVIHRLMTVNDLEKVLKDNINTHVIKRQVSEVAECEDFEEFQQLYPGWGADSDSFVNLVRLLLSARTPRLNSYNLSEGWFDDSAGTTVISDIRTYVSIAQLDTERSGEDEYGGWRD